jgi:hypothetical protein
MIRGPDVLGYALLFGVCSAACESIDAADASSDARVQQRDAAHGSDHAEAGVADAGDASAGGPADAGHVTDARADASCPPECFRAFTCAASCGAPVFNNGCCPCPAGTVDTISCGNGQGGDAGGGYCTVPCTGAAPHESVVEACNAITSMRACQDHQEDEFPHGCRWVTPATAPCPPLP